MNPLPATPIRIFLADDHPIVRNGLRQEIERHNDLEIVGEAQNGPDVLKLLPQTNAHVLLLDVCMPGLSGLEVTRQLHQQRWQQHPESSGRPLIIILSAYNDPEYIYNLIAAGVNGYLLKDETPPQIIQGVREAMKGNPVLSQAVQKTLLRPKTPSYQVLTEREQEVLYLIARGKADAEIGHELQIREGTVRNHLANIYGKLNGVNARAEAVAWAWQCGMVQRKSQRRIS